MAQNELNFNDFVRKLEQSQSQISKIIKKEANLSLATIAQLYALMQYKPI